MRLKLIAAVAAVLLAAACESKQETASAGATAEPGSVAHFQQTAGDRVFFDTDRTDLNPTARDTLNKQAAWLKQYGNRYARVTVEGHADERGTREYNLALGARRAASVQNYLVSQGIPSSKLATISYGKERPEVVGSDEGAWARNRRGVTVLGQ